MTADVNGDTSPRLAIIPWLAVIPILRAACVVMVFSVILHIIGCNGSAFAQTLPGPADAAGETGPDPTEADTAHYSTEFENDRVRVLRITYPPGEESVMHYHPDAVAIFVSAHDVEFGLPDGSSVESHPGAGEYAFTPAGQHLPKNIGEEPLTVLLVELK